MTFEIGVTSATFWQYPIHESVEKIYQHGFSIIELAAEFFESYLHNFKEGVGKLNQLREKLNLVYTVHGPVTGFNIGSRSEVERKMSVERLNDYINITNQVGAKILVLHLITAVPSQPKTFEEFLKLENEYRTKYHSFDLDLAKYSLLECCDNAEEKDVKLCLENSQYDFGPHVIEDFEEIFKLNRKCLALTYDPAHDMLTNRENLEWIKIFRNKLKHFHAVDYIIGDIDSHPLLGKGNVDFSQLLTTLTEISYEGYLILENFRIEDAIKSKEYLGGLMK